MARGTPVPAVSRVTAGVARIPHKSYRTGIGHRIAVPLPGMTDVACLMLDASYIMGALRFQFDFHTVSKNRIKLPKFKNAHSHREHLPV